jgi:hypothetical protein
MTGGVCIVKRGPIARQAANPPAYRKFLWTSLDPLRYVPNVPGLTRVEEETLHE